MTVTDKRIIRYFMTIPEASQLVMTSGAMAKNGDLYVLDMGKPVKILELAENMVRLSGFEPYKDIDIVETGLRPGEKLYEELLIKTETLDKTDNDMIFIERDKPLGKEEIDKKLDILREALKTQSNSTVKKALMEVVPEFHTPEEVNEKAIEAEEMRQAAGKQPEQGKAEEVSRAAGKKPEQGKAEEVRQAAGKQQEQGKAEEAVQMAGKQPKQGKAKKRKKHQAAGKKPGQGNANEVSPTTGSQPEQGEAEETRKASGS